MIAGVGTTGGLNISQQCCDVPATNTCQRLGVERSSVHHQMAGDFNQGSPLKRSALAFQEPGDLAAKAGLNVAGGRRRSRDEKRVTALGQFPKGLAGLLSRSLGRQCAMSPKSPHLLAAVLLPTEVVPTDLMVFTAKISDEYPAVNSLLSSVHRGSSICGRDGEHIVRGYWSADALQFKFANRLDRDGVLDRHQDTRADQNLPWLGLVAKPRCDIGYRSNRGIIEPSFESNSPMSGISVRYTDANPIS